MKPLQALKHTHTIAATLRACGLQWNEIAPLVGVGPSYLKDLAESPLFKAEVQRVAGRLQSKVVDNAVDMLLNESLKSVETLVQIRDNATAVGERRRAADSILDRIPRTSKTQRHIDGGPPKVDFTDAQLQYMIDALNDDPLAREAFERAALPEAIDIDPLEARDQAEPEPDEEFN